LIGIAQLSILTHLLSPRDYGLMAIVMVVIGFTRLFADVGVSNAIIHKQDSTHQQLSTLYWLNIFSGITLFFLIVGISPLIAWFYDEPTLVGLLIVLSTTFIVGAFGTQFRVLLQKDLQFKLLTKIEIFAAIGAFTIAVMTALYGAGVYSLVLGALASTFFSTIALLIVGLKKYRPSLVFQINLIRSYIKFGFFQMGENSITYFNSQFDVILIGKLLGVEALGVYSIAKNISMRPAQVINPIVTRVSFPIMAKVQSEIHQLKKIYLTAVNAISSVNFPIYVTIALLAEPLVLTLFGNQWEKSIPLLRILSIYGAVRSTGNPVGSLQLARGRADLGFYWNLGLFMVIPLAIFIGSNWGTEGVAYSLLILMLMLFVPNWWLMVRPLCQAGFIEYFKAISVPAIHSLIAGVVAFFVYTTIDTSYNKLVISSTIGFVVYGLLFRKFNNSVKAFFN